MLPSGFQLWKNDEKVCAVLHYVTMDSLAQFKGREFAAFPHISDQEESSGL